MSITVSPVNGRADLKAFVDLPARIFAGNDCWVPMFSADYRAFYSGKHPFFAHAETEFLLARRDTGEPVGRVLMIRNDRYNAEHGRNAAQFYFLDFVDDADAVDALFAAMESWASARGLDTLMGPIFSGATLGAGILIKGHDRPAAMTMMPYHHPYYQEHLERLGYGKRFDLLSLEADPESFKIPERVERLADHVRRRGRMRVLEFTSKRELKKVAQKVAGLYNPTLADHTENYPLTDDELNQLIKDLLQIAQPELEKVIEYDGDVIGYMLAFPDVTPAMQRSNGRLNLRSIMDLLRTSKSTKKLILNGMGILEKYQRLGGNALIYSELSRTLTGTGHYAFEEAEMVQINEQTELMLADMFRLGARECKRHRVYDKTLNEETS
jgi:hypothetical protein